MTKQSEQKINQIKKIIQQECKNSKDNFIRDYFFAKHLLAVEKFAKKLLRHFPQANDEIVMLGVWLHDLQRIRSIKGDHQKMGAKEAEKVMREFKYDKKIINKVKNIILTHNAYGGNIPKTLEGKILACADAMTHYYNDFFLDYFKNKNVSLSEFKNWSLEKLNRNYSKKIVNP